MVSKEQFINLMDTVRDVEDGHYMALEAIGLTAGEDKITHLIDEVVAFAAAVIGDKGLPEKLDTCGVFNHCGHDTPILAWWAWDIGWGTERPCLVVNGKEWPISNAAEVYDLIKYVNSTETWIKQRLT